MKKQISILLLMLLLISGIQTFHIQAATKVNYKSYYNDRFNYTLKYPSKFTKTTHSENNDGIILTTSKEDAKCLIWGSYNVMEDTGKTLLQSMKLNNPKALSSSADKKSCTYKYKEGKQIIYEFNYITNGVILGFQITYPSSQSKYYDTAIKAMKISMKKNKNVE